MSETNNITAGLLNPGAMGSTVGRCIQAANHRIIWAGDGRSEASHQRAADNGFENVGSVQNLVQQSDVIFSICPPAAAADIATEVAAQSFSGIYVDANAISTDTTDKIKTIIESAGGNFVDGGIIGPPASRPGTTRLYVSGPQAAVVVPLLADGLLPAILMSEKTGDASALKMAYAAYTKGHSALLLLSRSLARAYHIENHLLDEWALSQNHLDDLCHSECLTAAKKAWRFNNEMREIADTMGSAGLPDNFHLGAAELYDRLASFQHREGLPALEEVLDKLVAEKH